MFCVVFFGVVKGANLVSMFEGSFCRPSIECLWRFDLMRRDGSRVAGVRGVVCVHKWVGLEDGVKVQGWLRWDGSYGASGKAIGVRW